jgi:hypothetical protein
MTKITEDDINKAFDKYIDAFNDLAHEEDELEAMKYELSDYKEGSTKYNEAMAEIRDFEQNMAKFQRVYRLAAVELDRIKVLVSMQIK